MTVTIEDVRGYNIPDHPMEYWVRAHSFTWFQEGGDCKVSFFFEKWFIVKHTAKGAWLGPYPNYNLKLCRFCLKAGRKRFAYPTKEEAWESLKIRTQWRVSHCRNALTRAIAVEAVLKGKQISQNSIQIFEVEDE